MNPVGAARLRSAARNSLTSAPGAGMIRTLRAGDHPRFRFITGPLPVVLVGAIIGIAPASGRAWIPFDAQLYWQASERLDHLYADGWIGAYNYASPPPIAQL